MRPNPEERRELLRHICMFPLYLDGGEDTFNRFSSIMQMIPGISVVKIEFGDFEPPNYLPSFRRHLKKGGIYTPIKLMKPIDCGLLHSSQIFIFRKY